MSAKTSSSGPSGTGQLGFTLMEVLVAVLILAIGMVAVVKSAYLAQNALDRSRTAVESMELARSKLAEVEEAGLDKWMELNGDFGKEHPGFSWRLEIEPMALEGMARTMLVVLSEPGGNEAARLEKVLWAVSE